MKKIALFVITAYQKTISLDTGFIPRLFGFSRTVCIFYPRCSEYAKEAISIHGVWKGSKLAVTRIARCNPLSEPGVDPVPGKK